MTRPSRLTVTGYNIGEVSAKSCTYLCADPKVLRMDLTLNRRDLVVWALLMTAGLAWLSSTTPLVPFLAFSAIWSALIPLSALAREDRYNVTALSCSLPVTRRSLVRSRYVGAWLVMLAAMLYAALFAVVNPRSIIAGEVVSLRAAGIGLTALTLCFGPLFPFVLRFGRMGLMLFLLGVQLLGVVAFLLATLLEGSLKASIGTVIDGIAGLVQTAGPSGVWVIALSAIVGLNLASLLCSEALFARRDL